MNWNNIIKQEEKKPYFIELNKFLDNEYKNKTIYPARKNIFKAFELCKYDNLKVVILGQDPYHQPNQAQGLAFSTPASMKNPPSMVNILKELLDDISNTNCLDGDLTPWAKQGVLLINSVLSVEHNKANSHKNKGWEIFTDNIIKHISENMEGIIFVLWGNPAIKKSKLIDQNKHFILTSAHPSPLSSYRGFFGSKPFSKINEILKQSNKQEIIW
jgi:uracil-DNA glycosylase